MVEHVFKFACWIWLCWLPLNVLGAEVMPIKPVSRLTWRSVAVGHDLKGQLHFPASTSDPKKVPLVIYLQGLFVPRIGREPDASIIASFLVSGSMVLALNYDQAEHARPPQLNLDICKIRHDIFHKQFLANLPLDINHVFILPAGYRLLRDVPFYKAGDRTLAMDVSYPANPEKLVPAIIEYSCDNKDRMGLFSLDFCTDTLLEGAMASGFATAMADHPVAAPYKGLDPMPDCIYKLKASVRVLRLLKKRLPLNGHIASLGFSRGSGMALMLASTSGNKALEGHGPTLGVSSDVQAAVVLSGRFDYTDILPTDHMIPRYKKAWGLRDTHLDTWKKESAAYYLSAKTPPLFLSINFGEDADAIHQMDGLVEKVSQLGIRHEYLPEVKIRGHRMPLDPNIISAIYAFLHTNL